jgi:integrase
VKNTIPSFHLVQRPAGIKSRYAVVVVDGNGVPHLPLTTFYQQMQQQLSDGAARTYLNSLRPYFSYLATDEWRQRRGDCWDSDPEAVQESVRDYLLRHLGCKIRHHQSYEEVTLTAHSPSTVRIFLAALKQFYFVMRHLDWYAHSHPLLDTTTQVLLEVEQEEHKSASKRATMPQQSGVEEPGDYHPSENLFRLTKDEWIPHPIDDPDLPKQLMVGFKRAKLCVRDQIVVRMAFESGARIGELLHLTVGDWRERGGNQEARACSKGSRGRRVKVIRFSDVTARMLREYINTDRATFDAGQRRLELLEHHDKLFLSQRGKPYTYEAFKPHWYRLCAVLGLDMGIHALRHWYTTQAMRVIAETAKTSAELELRKEELVRYMAWRSPDTLRAYEHYFKGVQHYAIQDQIHRRLADDAAVYTQTNGNHVLEASSKRQLSVSENAHSQSDSDGWSILLALGGAQEHER